MVEATETEPDRALRQLIVPAQRRSTYDASSEPDEQAEPDDTASSRSPKRRLSPSTFVETNIQHAGNALDGTAVQLDATNRGQSLPTAVRVKR